LLVALAQGQEGQRVGWQTRAPSSRTFHGPPPPGLGRLPRFSGGTARAAHPNPPSTPLLVEERTRSTPPTPCPSQIPPSSDPAGTVLLRSGQQPWIRAGGRWSRTGARGWWTASPRTTTRSRPSTSSRRSASSCAPPTPASSRRSPTSSSSASTTRAPSSSRRLYG